MISKMLAYKINQCMNILWERSLYPKMVVSCEHDNKTTDSL